MDDLSKIFIRAAVNQSSDPNIGKAKQTGSSLSAFLSSLILDGLIFLAMVGMFLILRRSQRRTYAPRTYIGTIPEEKRIQDLPKGIFGWIKPLYDIPGNVILGKTSLDSYFFLRYLKMGMFVSFVGCIITFPILLPVNATGGAGKTGLDVVSFGNIDNKTHGGHYYAHAILAWIYIPFLLFTIYREMMHYTAVRHAYMMSPLYCNRISARTLLISSVPKAYLSVPALLRLFDNVARIWINTDTDELEDIVEERDKLANKVEAAEIKYIRTADKNRRKAIKKGTASSEDAEQGSAGQRWVPTKQRPTHKLKFLIGKKVDTLEYGRGELQRLNEEIKGLQAKQKTDQVGQFNSAFIEFTSQTAAQTALQCLTHNRPLHMAPRYIGISPEEVIWKNLKIQWWQRLVKTVLVTTFIVLLVVFWSVPVAIVGLISNINYLTEKVHFLRFINHIPKSILGVITGFLPTVMLAVLMALLPIILRLCARLSGVPSLSLVELHVQNSYFAFQVVQVFLVTTLSSAISASIVQIKNNPGAVTTILSSNLPAASNFYISYMILQGLVVSGGLLLQIVGLILGKVLGMLLDTTPRKKWNRWTRLSGLSWGTLFPVFTNLVVIALTYSLIAPLVMLFATIGFTLFWLAYKYNILFVYDSQIDTQGLVYPRALYQTMTGIYLLELCMIGLFGVSASPGPLVIMVILLVFTVLFQMALSSAMEPLLHYLPRNVEEEEAGLLEREESAGANKDGSVVQSTPKGNMFSRFLHPEVYMSYEHARSMLPRNQPEPTYTAEERENAYIHPAVSSREPIFWLAKDEAGVSKEEIEANRAVGIQSTDEYAWVNDKSKVEWEQMLNGEQVNPPDYYEKPRW